MADKKIPGLDTAGAITANDLFVVNQDPATGKALKVTGSQLRAFVLGGANAGARIYFDTGVPSGALGVDGDVYFDKQAKEVYQKISGAWVFQDSYSTTAGATGIIRFTAVYDSGGLSADGLTYHSDDLVGAVVLSVTVDITPLIAVEEPEDVPAFDEFNHDAVAGDIAFGAPLPAGFRITIIYTI